MVAEEQAPLERRTVPRPACWQAGADAEGAVFCATLLGEQKSGKKSHYGEAAKNYYPKLRGKNY
ncbi:hypothetical protein A3H10_00190 [Candidatus Uhrbacteria bacterium RIFCSPLOWO2_12_FULL_46_10]|uniref:Uncharacterized protein n=1 Tax=Candidatus Uhrbacteria bacterium RIFCSPLOWO2_01_FULL_47_25 TaxID=1802402 RepID=A0A1F7UVZ2_9BACT|nr:MAG: hypothetical protein A2752_04825 [Candidatus Uhrbacteria bacterium RIFCSPHIGHO2_01_FULL_46_23]OGL69399.1 MAG: hypothetical protein A3D60_00980 [Candidatus Uhrbacteria bacterium RIFCSPHIGHO2_02_FULL_47_29]OGL76486.1 MAG: hypothetical protein A3E96_03185 [Candidatus Uhrbacteria bacterium RIFCSPHIGHO2_12_FULL_46_13]OGL82439.1 MAG: hypothetical protein A2936_03210 [Candidatus Uhrbacteria bacterium RIFCSPLOWO2_01_FULL_47_25]OGL91242.1 MAG: hypothetical protein A3H10_00190 [Candidatus Uhrbact